MPKIASKPRQPELAVNLFDLDRLDPELRVSLLKGRLDLKNPVGVQKRLGEEKDGVAAPLTCDLLTAATVCDVIRSEDRRANDRPTRVYRWEGGRWRKLPDDAVLTLTTSNDPRGGQSKLSPAWFQSAAPLPGEPVRFGRAV